MILLAELAKRARESDSPVLQLTAVEWESVLPQLNVENQHLWQPTARAPGHKADGCTGIGGKPVVIV